jgi:Fic-DOC domain mobile mystery protein B
MFGPEPDGATPVDPDEAEDLIPSHVRTRGELNEWEQANILEAAAWVERTRADPLDEAAIRGLHRRMFDRTWKWAGRYRLSDKNIGVHWAQIPVRIRDFVEDGRLWIREGVHPPDEAALRLHHRLVWVHPFPNGNGRHARLWCDLLTRRMGRPPFPWRSRELDAAGAARAAYIAALRAADGGDFGPLFELLLVDRPA